MDTKERALKLAGAGISIFPLASNSKAPFKGSRGYLDATTDLQTIGGWFEHVPRLNLGMRLDTAGLLVVDVDRHGQTDGVATLRRLNQEGKRLPGDTYIERTPNDGLHYFFKLTDPLSVRRRTNLYPAVDVLHDFVMIAPSQIDDHYYQAVDPSNSIRPAPQWLIRDLLPSQRMNEAPERASNIHKTWTGRVLDELVAGTSEGNRNSFLTSLLGKIFNTGCQSVTAYELLQYANSQLKPPLPDKEVNTIFRSIIKRV
ncbi:bifunctional DNA primase/polymerase [Lactiplantibacillus songbeiensis]|uniref:Bifunctional DNA primase/polymerase n=1 Tax=Lactiplantibacillus songbeiensis TaxID=2559920 RepID=A0ABW4BXU2_9LACO|nr:bifunctional DNA primase/polymerase [Lactiplantibacillus songbeiensis]